MPFLFSLLVFFSFHLKAEPLKVLSSQKQVAEEGPSCRILHHRELEREKMIRELMHLKEISQDSKLGDLMLQNYLHLNKEFLDHQLWEDESVRVTHLIEFSEKMKAMEFDMNLIQFKDVGFSWTGPIYNFPEDVSFEVIDENTFKMSYSIYLIHHCRQPEAQPLVELLDYEDEDTGKIMATLQRS